MSARQCEWDHAVCTRSVRVFALLVVIVRTPGYIIAEQQWPMWYDNRHFFVVKVPLSSVEKGPHTIYLGRTQNIGLLHYLPLLMEAMEARKLPIKFSTEKNKQRTGTQLSNEAGRGQQ